MPVLPGHLPPTLHLASAVMHATTPSHVLTRALVGSVDLLPSTTADWARSSPTATFSRAQLGRVPVTSSHSKEHPVLHQPQESSATSETRVPVVLMSIDRVCRVRPVVAQSVAVFLPPSKGTSPTTLAPPLDRREQVRRVSLSTEVPHTSRRSQRRKATPCFASSRSDSAASTDVSRNSRDSSTSSREGWATPCRGRRTMQSSTAYRSPTTRPVPSALPRRCVGRAGRRQRGSTMRAGGGSRSTARPQRRTSRGHGTSGNWLTRG